jgi:hypothetical protein
VRRPAAGAIVLIATLAVAAACSTPPPVASNAVPPPATAAPAPVVWAALGGDETVTADPETAPGAWSQRVLSGLPASAQLLNVATERATVAVGLDSQLAALAAGPAPPTVATVWFGPADTGTSSARFRATLSELVGELQSMGVPRIVLIGRPDVIGAHAEEVEAVAGATRTSYVPVTALSGPAPAAQAAIAEQVGPLIAGP